MHNPGHEAAILRYARLRRSAYDLAREQVIDSGIADDSVRLADVDHWTLESWRRTWRLPHPSGAGGWDWTGLVERFGRDPAVFKPALWSSEFLCGLAIGRPSRRQANGRRSALLLHYLEGNPDPAHPLKGAVAPVMIAAAENYARVVGAASVRLLDPLPGVLRVYRRAGFRVERTRGGALYCEKEVSP